LQQLFSIICVRAVTQLFERRWTKCLHSALCLSTVGVPEPESGFGRA